MPNVNFTRKEVTDTARQWMMVRDAVAGEVAVKRRRQLYLPIPSPDDMSQANLLRYNAYLTRAVFYGVTGRTIRGMVGQVFSRDPEIILPPTLAFLNSDVDGLGVSLTQQAKASTGEGVSVGRGGLLSDFPNMGDAPVTMAQLTSGEVAPSITLYRPEQIINWRYKTSGSTKFLTLVVLKEKYTTETDMFATKENDRWRVLRLEENGFYVQEVWYGDSGPRPEETSRPRDAEGNRLNYIPFDFLGSDDNSPDIDPVPAYDLASLNIAHYRNSADRERSGFVYGEATVVVSGLDKDWLDTVLGGVVALGTQGGLPLPQGATVELLQAEPNTMVGEMMKDKERQMVALGAQLVQQSDVQRTATESRSEDASKSSTLSNVADNVSAAYTNALTTCERFVTTNPGRIRFQLNKVFSFHNMDSAGRAQLIKEWQAEAITFTEMRHGLRQAGIATLDDKIALEKIAEEVAARAANAPEAEPITQPEE